MGALSRESETRVAIMQELIRISVKEVKDPETFKEMVGGVHAYYEEMRSAMKDDEPVLPACGLEMMEAHLKYHVDKRPPSYDVYLYQVGVPGSGRSHGSGRKIAHFFEKQ